MPKNSEHVLQQAIRQSIGMHDRFRIFRNNVGMAFRGKTPIRYGLCEGSSDLIGVKAVEITEGMVGATIGQFVAIEVKSSSGVVSEDQRAFLRVIKDLGGLCIVARSLDDIKELFE